MKLPPPLCPEPISARRGGAIQGAGRSYTAAGRGYTGGGAELFSGGAGLYRGRCGAIQGMGRGYSAAGRGYTGGGAIQGAGCVQENLLSCPSMALIFVYVNVNAP